MSKAFEDEKLRQYLDTPEERIEVYFVHGAVINVGAITVPPVLLCVPKKMLHACLNSSTLDADNCLV